MAAKNPRWPSRNSVFAISTSNGGDFPRIIEIAFFNIPSAVNGSSDNLIVSDILFKEHKRRKNPLSSIFTVCFISPMLDLPTLRHYAY